MIDHGTFARYSPTIEEQPVLATIPNALFSRREDGGEDWYEFALSLSPGTMKLLLDGDVVVSAARDATALRDPAGLRLIEVEMPEAVEPETLLRQRFVDGEIAPAPDPVPAAVSDRQFFQALALRGEISEEEALEAVGPGIIPAQMEGLIEQLPPGQKFGAKMLVRGATTYERNHPLAALIGQLYGWDDAALDAFWREAAAL